MNMTDRTFWNKQGILLIALVLLTVSYFPDGMVLWDQWSASQEFNHGPLMLAVALYLLWKRRALFLAGGSSHSWFGLILIIGAGLLSLGSLKAAIVLPRHYAFLVLIYGLFLFAGGRRYGSFVLPSLVLLLFVIPPPGAVSADLTWGLQLFSSDLSVALLRAFGVTVFQDGNVIDLGIIKLEVAEACAGLRYLYPMMGLGVMIGMLFDISWVKRVVFLLIAALIAILMNSVRIFLTGIVADMTDLGVSQGFFHLFEGWVFFIVTFILTLFLCRLVLKKQEWNSLGRGYFTVENIDTSSSSSLSAAAPKIGYPTITALVLILLIVPGALFARTGDVFVPERSSFISFPLNLDGRVGTRQKLSQTEIEVLRMTDYFLGGYKAPNPYSSDILKPSPKARHRILRGSVSPGVGGK